VSKTRKLNKKVRFIYYFKTNIHISPPSPQTLEVWLLLIIIIINYIKGDCGGQFVMTYDAIVGRHGGSHLLCEYEVRTRPNGAPLCKFHGHRVKYFRIVIRCVVNVIKCFEVKSTIRHNEVFIIVFAGVTQNKYFIRRDEDYFHFSNPFNNRLTKFREFI